MPVMRAAGRGGGFRDFRGPGDHPWGRRQRRRRSCPAGDKMEPHGSWLVGQSQQVIGLPLL